MLDQAGVTRDRHRSARRRDRTWRVHRPADRPGGHAGPRDDADKPAIGVSALDALASRSVRRARRPTMPVARGWTRSAARCSRRVIDRRSGGDARDARGRSPRALLGRWRAHLANRRAIFIGDAAVRDAAVIEQAGAALGGPGAGAAGAAIAIIGRRRARDGEAGSAARAEPIYVRRPDAEIERSDGRAASLRRRLEEPMWRADRRARGRRPRRRPGDRGGVLQQPDDA